MNDILQGDIRDVARTLPDESVHCIVTSPPYWGLRDYGTPGQLGLEPTPGQHVAEMVNIFRELRRVLRSDGTLWLNYGDSYATSVNGRSAAESKAAGDDRTFRDKPFGTAVGDLKPKDLVGMPWEVALALRRDGWWLRADCIWHKPNPMPESVQDRPTKAHEYLFLLAKSERYFYDAEAVREANVREWGDNNIGPNNRINTGIMEGKVLGRETNPHGGLNDTKPNPAGRNRRSVWTISTHAYPGAHFATFPPALVRPCILAGTSAKGVCPACGAPWVRVVKRVKGENASYNGSSFNRGKTKAAREPLAAVGEGERTAVATITGWRPTCACDAGEPVPAVVLDPFFGSGTVGVVALETGRAYLGVELNPDYIELARRRLADTQPALFAAGL